MEAAGVESGGSCVTGRSSDQLSFLLLSLLIGALTGLVLVAGSLAMGFLPDEWRAGPSLGRRDVPGKS